MFVILGAPAGKGEDFPSGARTGVLEEGPAAVGLTSPELWDAAADYVLSLVLNISIKAERPLSLAPVEA